MQPLLVDENYGFLDRVLHRLALNYLAVADVIFDVDQSTVKTDPTEIVHRTHVFISGLARAGSTVLMRRFHATARYRSLTYRDMPFVLAPNLWRRLSLISRRDTGRAERAHGDNLLVDYDSPEGLDEVFWRIFAGEQYIATDRLNPHLPNEELLNKYIRYVNAILSAQDSTQRRDRYLCKNNNNILRLGAIHQAFPKALILIPFREPVQHAQSLLRQHIRFWKMQVQRDFVLRYMSWLGHHEFGLGHRPFRFDGKAPCVYPVDTLNYWLHLWCEVCSWLVRSKPPAALFVCYEDFCSRPETWRRLAELADIPAENVCGDPVRLNERPEDRDCDGQLRDRARAIYSSMVTQARGQLS